MKIKILTWKQIKCKSTKHYDKSRIPIGDGYIFNHKMKYLCGTIVDLDAESQVYDETNNIYWTITDWMIDKSYTETIYPIFFKGENNGEVLKFNSPSTCEVVVAGRGSNNTLGDTINIHHSVLEVWEELPYDRERDLFHTQAVLCHDENVFFEAIQFYDAKHKCCFTSTGEEYGSSWGHYKAYPEQQLSNRMKQLRTTLSEFLVL
jgi:hypothetical protein